MGRAKRLEASKGTQEGFSSSRSNAGNIVQLTSQATVASSRAMVGNGETMGFIAELSHNEELIGVRP